MATPKSQRKLGETIRSEARTIVRNVVMECDEESRIGSVKHPLKQATLRAATYAGVSVRTISRIREGRFESEEGPSHTARGTKRPRGEVDLDDFAKKVIRSIIEDFYLKQNKVPTARKLLSAIRKKMDLPMDIQMLRSVLRDMGFKWKRFTPEKKILIEKPSLIARRGKYLSAVREYRSQNKEIIYLDQSWMDTNLIYKKCWQTKDEEGVQLDPANQLIVISAASSKGLIKPAQLMYCAKRGRGSFKGQMDSANFEKWILDKLIPNLPKECVVVMNDAPYQNMQIDKPPSKYSVKDTMMEWLTEKNIPHDPEMRKFELWELIEEHKPKSPIYKIDEYLKTHGHQVLRLPPYMKDFNIIELAWAKVKTHVIEAKVSDDFSIAKLQKIMENGMSEVTTEDWHEYGRQVQKMEDDWWERDGLMEDAIDKFITNIEFVWETESESESEVDEIKYVTDEERNEI